MKKFISLLFIFILISQQGLLIAQSYKQFILTNNKKTERQYIINTDHKVSIYYYDVNGESQTQRGLLTINDSSSFYIDSSLYQIKDIYKIHAKTNKIVENQIVAASLGGLGLGLETYGIIMIAIANKKDGLSDLSKFIHYLVGIGAITLGTALLISALIVTANKTDYFKLDKDWTLTIE